MKRLVYHQEETWWTWLKLSSQPGMSLIGLRMGNETGESRKHISLSLLMEDSILTIDKVYQIANFGK